MAKNENKFIWLFGIGAALWLLWGRTLNSIINLGFKLIGIQVVSLSKETTTLNLQVAIKNPTLYTLTLWAIKFNLSFNGEYIATIDQQINRKIRSKVVTTLNIQVTINNTEIVNKLVENKSLQIVYEEDYRKVNLGNNVNDKEYELTRDQKEVYEKTVAALDKADALCKSYETAVLEATKEMLGDEKGIQKVKK